MLIEYPGKTEEQIREINKRIMHAIGGALFTVRKYIGQAFAPYFAVIERTQLREAYSPDDDTELSLVG